MNTATANNPESPAVSETASRVLKIATCPSLSGKSTLTYHIGRSAESEIQFRIVDNTNIGFFSREWVPLSVIQREFDKVPVGKTITSFLLHALFRGKSVNTPAFLFAVLKNEGLVQPAKDKQRQYERMDPAAFLAAVRTLIEAKVDLKWDEPSKTKAEPVKAMGKSTKAAKGDVVAKVSAKAATVDAKSIAKSAKVDAVVPKVDASPSQTAARGVDIAEIVEVINAKVPASEQKGDSIAPTTEPAMPAKKAATKAKK